jgi:ribonuclease PH
MRPDGRAFDELRRAKLTPHYTRYPEGSVLIEMGDTRVLCNATVQEEAPPWLRGGQNPGRGWVTAEYAMLPRATPTRTARETHGPNARSQEIRRLIGRALRASVDLDRLGERTFTLDCDVLQADGGTRTAAVTGAYVALVLALRPLITQGRIDPAALLSPVAAVSVGVVDGESRLDLAYAEDSRAEVDFNVVMNARGEYVEVQGTAESRAFPRATLDRLLALAEGGIAQLLTLQAETLR